MIEVESRWGLSKKGKFWFGTEEMVFPNILYIDDDRINEYVRADIDGISLSDSEDSDLTVSSSIFKENGFSIQRSFGYPDLIGGDVVERSPSSSFFQVLYDQEPRDSAGIYVIANAPELFTSPKYFVDKIISIRKKIAYHKLLYAPGIARPNNIALLSYLGIELFDTIYCDLMSARGVTTTDWLGMDSQEPGDNRSLLRNELDIVEKSIERGRIRDLVETRVRSEPRLVEMLRYADKYYDDYSYNIPVTGGDLCVTTFEGLYRPDIQRFRNRLRERYVPPERGVLLLLPCSARKPYFQSKTHGIIRGAINQGNWTDVQEVILTSPMGSVPRDIEMFYPAKQYDIPVSHKWLEEEKRIILETLEIIIERGDYRTIICHLPPDMDFVRENIDCIDTVKGEHPTDKKALENLAESVVKNTKPGRSHQGFLHQNITSFAEFQFGPAGGKLTEGAVIKGRYPNYRIMKEEDQIGMLVAERGLISLTLSGGEILLNEDEYVVEIDDFRPKGTVFAVGVMDADKKICPEDDCVLAHEGELKGVGAAIMSGREMKSSERGGAVRSRHYV
ncbi:MAG: DUF5591 domain-containing protein [Thermoplasmata archaeon]